MQLTPDEKKIIRGDYGRPLKTYLEYLLEFGSAYGAKKLIDISYAHVHSGMSLYEGDIEFLEEIANSGLKVRVPTTSNIFSADLMNWPYEGELKDLMRHQKRAETAHRKLGITGCYTCTPFLAGYAPLKGTHISCFESGVIAHYNAMHGARTNRDGLFSIYAALTGKYPCFGLHEEKNRKGTHLFTVSDSLTTVSDYSALGFYIGEMVDNGIPVITGAGLNHMDPESIIALEAAMATSGSVAMYHIPGITAEAQTVEDAFGNRSIPHSHLIEKEAIASVYEKLSGENEQGHDGIYVVGRD